MIHVAALAGAIIWLGLNGLLWYMRPSDSCGYLALQFWAQSFSAHSLFICNGLITALSRSRTLDKMISPCRLWVDGVEKVSKMKLWNQTGGIRQS
jgi:hypothetical protein